MIRLIFENEFKEIYFDIFKMGVMVEEVIDKVILVFKIKDVEFVCRIIDNDDKIDEFIEEIEKKCVIVIVI